MSEELHEYQDSLPNLGQNLLPARACLLSVRDELAPARRLALADSISTAKGTFKGDEEKAMAILGCMWEAGNCLELAANLCAPWIETDAKTESGIWPHLAEYDPTRTNRFYESSHKWSDERFMALSAHSFRVQGSYESFLGQLQTMGDLDDSLVEAFEKAQDATAAYLKSMFKDLADTWKKLRVYSNAFEHGLLSIPASVGTIRDSDGDEMPHLLAIWKIGKNEVHGDLSESAEAAIRLASNSGRLALDLVDHVANARLRITDLLEFRNGKTFLRRWDSPFPFWVSKGDLDDGCLELLRSTGIGWVRESEVPPVA